MLKKLINRFWKFCKKPAVNFLLNYEKDFDSWCESEGIKPENLGVCRKAWEASRALLVDSFLNSDESKWDYRFLMLARHISSWSLDPSTRVGAVIVDKSRRVVSVGYNGLPMGVEDSSERLNDRDIKNKIVCHAEANAIIFARRDLSGCTLYTWPFCSCSACSSLVIQSGITRCVAPPISEDLKKRWADSVKLSEEMFKEAGVELNILPC